MLDYSTATQRVQILNPAAARQNLFGHMLVEGTRDLCKAGKVKAGAVWIWAAPLIGIGWSNGDSNLAHHQTLLRWKPKLELQPKLAPYGPP